MRPQLRLMFAATAYVYGAVALVVAAFLFSPTLGVFPGGGMFDLIADSLCPRLDRLHVELFGEDDDE